MDQTQDQPNLSLGDITLALQVIQVAASRGAFKAEEYTEIGGCYDRIFKFLEASGAIQRTSEAEPAAEESAEASVPAKKTTRKSK
jgi:hypothetical protein